jgi:hypothetical protein
MLNGVLGAMVKDTKIEIKAKVLNWKDFFLALQCIECTISNNILSFLYCILNHYLRAPFSIFLFVIPRQNDEHHLIKSHAHNYEIWVKISNLIISSLSINQYDRAYENSFEMVLIKDFSNFFNARLN